MNPAALLAPRHPGHLPPFTRTPRARQAEVLVKRRHHAFLILLSISLSTVTDAAKAGPFQEFFRTLRSAIAHPKETPRPHRSTQKRKKTPPSQPPRRGIRPTSGGRRQPQARATKKPIYPMGLRSRVNPA